MKRYLIFSFALIILLMLFSCAKKETQVSSSETAPLSSSDLSACYGQIDFQEYLTLGTDSNTLLRMPMEARFYDLPLVNKTKKDLDVGELRVNGILLKYFGGPATNRVYSDTSKSLFVLPAFTLTAAGTKNVPKFECLYSSGNPDFTDTLLLPSVIKRSAALELSFKGVLNSDSLIFSIERDAFHKIEKRLFSKGVKELTLNVSRNEIVDLMQNEIYATIRLEVFKRTLIQADTKNYLVYSKKVITKPVLVELF